MPQGPFSDPQMSALESFTDRFPEAEALLESISQLRTRVTNRTFSDRGENVLAFYGIGGVGKTSLSIALQSWLELRPLQSSHWGPPGCSPRAHTVRWDLDQPSNRSDPIPFLLAFRKALNHAAPVWSAFDIALASLFAALHPNDSYTATRQRDADTMTDVLLGLASDAGAFDVTTSLSRGMITRVVRTALKSAQFQAALQDYPELPKLLDDIAEGAESPQHLPLLTNRTLQLATKQIQNFTPTGRPSIVVFVDTFEKVQTPGELNAERLVCEVAAALPHVLFVLTGRNLVTWHQRDRAALGKFGPATWPSLARTSDGELEPRQHLVGNLSPEDTAALISDRLAAHGVGLSARSLATATQASRGLPMHIDLIVSLAIQLHSANPGTEITSTDLDGSAADVANRLISHLPADAARALQGCAVTPYFDVALAAAAADVDEGAVQRLTRESLVLPSVGAHFPFRLHEDVRALVRAAGPYAIGGWTEGDWRTAANRALEHLEERFARAKESDQVVDRLHLHAAAVLICLESGIRKDWVGAEMRKTPSKGALSGALPPIRDEIDDDELRAAVRLNRALALPVSERLPELEPLRHSPFPKIVESATLWSAYAHRALRQHDAALPLLAELKQAHPESGIYPVQYLTTFAMARRYRDLVDEAAKDAANPTAVIASVHRSHGDIDAAVRCLEARLKDAVTRDHARAWRLELEGSLVSYRAESGQFDDAGLEILRRSARTLHQTGATSSAAYAMGLRDLGSKHLAEHWNKLIEVYDESAGRHGGVRMMTLAGLRVLGWGDTSFMEDLAPIRPTFDTHLQVWIPCELLHEQLGSPLPHHETQWLEPKQTVVDRWMKIFENLITRAKCADAE
jgi:hypothetical protein